MRVITVAKERLARIGYACVRNLPASFCPYFPWGSRLRGFFARGFISCGRNVNIEHGAVFSKHVTLGDNSGIGIHAQLTGTVVIGAYVMMAPDVVIITSNHATDRVDIPMQQQGTAAEQPVIIRDDVWIGQRVMILPGVEIGQGSIIGACAVVTKNVPPYAIVAGNPARIIRSRMPTANPEQTETTH